MAIAPFVIIDMTVFLVSAVGWLYTSFTLFFDLQILEISYDPLLNSIVTFVLAMSYIWRIWHKCNLTQEFLNVRSLVLNELQSDFMENFNLLDRRLKWKAEIVEERLANPDIYAPNSFFTMNRATFLPSLASAFTYFIIIVQFKLSET